MIAPQTALRALRRLGPSSAQALAADLGVRTPEARVALSQLAALGAAVKTPRRPEVWRATEAAGVVARAAEDREDLIRVLRDRSDGATAETLAVLCGWGPARTAEAIKAARRAKSIRLADTDDGARVWVWASAVRRGAWRTAPTPDDLAMWAALRSGGATWAEVAYRADRPIEAVRAAVSRAAKKDPAIVRRAVDSATGTH